jgi:4-carboxymuconolactone decarboxylase
MPYVTDEDATPDAARALASVQARRGFVSNTHRSLAHSPSALLAFEQFSMHVNGESRLDARTRELAILRTAQLVGNLYEWRRHVPKGLESGLSVAEISGLADWRSGPLGARDRTVLSLVDEHVSDGEVTASTVEAVRDMFGDELLVELLVTVGWYLLVSAIILPLDLVGDDPEPPDLAVPFTDARRAVLR